MQHCATHLDDLDILLGRLELKTKAQPPLHECECETVLGELVVRHLAKPKQAVSDLEKTKELCGRKTLQICTLGCCASVSCQSCAQYFWPASTMAAMNERCVPLVR